MGTIDKKRKIKIAIVGVCITGNMGGHALAHSLIDSLKRRYSLSDEDIEVFFFTKYPRDEVSECDVAGWRAVAYSTFTQMAYAIPFFVIGSGLKRIKLPYKWLIGGKLKFFKECDVVADLSGISFTDDRSFSGLIINTLWLLPPIVMGKPIIKISQTMGPFRKKTVHMISKYVLGKIDVIVARGEKSQKYVEQLLPSKKICNFPDIAFTLEAKSDKTEELLKNTGLDLCNGYNVIGPSTVVEEKLEDGRYVRIVYAGAKRLYNITQKPVLLVPHSRKHQKAAGVDAVHDDVHVCYQLEEMLKKEHIPCSTISAECDSYTLKDIIGKAHMAVGSRYHFLVAALSSGVPSVAIAWSHKYWDMFRLCGMEEFVISYEVVSDTVLMQMIEDINESYEMYAQNIRSKLPYVIEIASQNVEMFGKWII